MTYAWWDAVGGREGKWEKKGREKGKEKGGRVRRRWYWLAALVGQ